MATLDNCSECGEDLKVTAFSKQFYCGYCINMFAWSPDTWTWKCTLEYLFFSQKASAPASIINRKWLERGRGQQLEQWWMKSKCFVFKLYHFQSWCSFQFSVWFFLLSSFWPAFGYSSPLNRKWKSLQYTTAVSLTSSMFVSEKCWYQSTEDGKYPVIFSEIILTYACVCISKQDVELPAELVFALGCGLKQVLEQRGAATFHLTERHAFLSEISHL